MHHVAKDGAAIAIQNSMATLTIHSKHRALLGAMLSFPDICLRLHASSCQFCIANMELRSPMAGDAMDFSSDLAKKIFPLRIPPNANLPWEDAIAIAVAMA